MKHKIGTILDKELIWEAKKIALQEKRPFSDVLEEALKEYLAKKSKAHSKKNIVQKTKGIMKMSPKLVRAVMEEAGWYESE
ncbi:MAG: hypothetical protein A2Y62_20165 [Candidatus Fischerbacteria bacterium RBG_13_37_8]|uniref:Ribbon-helix-helix protein CopG domain-containing protein n=1 Tax=Candidatus Fischerbacteria bacterium RBG_13_37_8 TaxID=1817863 RepID=A0A1F5V5F4_9BACT|nr:MAG: hypothetical protein A2Y62_20165 [Candidatus Fischerbacteria bacterium RBG_13_37_8]